jgi:predicted dehydrogenase
MSGIIGQVTAVSFEWLLDTHHGADYFRRWHRNKENSGGLFVHKATHHCDLLNWWLGAVPYRVSASAMRTFYRPEIADALGLTPRGNRCSACAAFDRCGFRLALAASDHLRTLYADNEAHDGYLRDKCGFSLEIDIEDTMHALIEYENGISANYKLTAYNPYEGYRVTFDGTRGRIEHKNVERSHVQTDGSLVRPPLPGGRASLFSRISVVPTSSHCRGPGATQRRRQDDAARAVPACCRTIRMGSSRMSVRSLVGDGRHRYEPSLHAGIPVARGPCRRSPHPDHVPEPFGPPAIWQTFDPARYSFLAGARLV